jgi:hypothetical protein
LNFLNLLNQLEISQITTLPERIVFVQQKRVLAGDPRASFDLRNQSGLLTDDRAATRVAAEERSGDAFVNEASIVSQETHRVKDRHHRGSRRSAR